MTCATQGLRTLGDSVCHSGDLRCLLMGVAVTAFVSLEDKSSLTLGILRVYTWDRQTPGTGGPGEGETYSTCLDQEGGSLMVMNTQLVKMVIMMNMLNSVGGRVKESEGAGGRGGGRRASCPPPSPPCLSPPLRSPHSGRI